MLSYLVCNGGGVVLGNILTGCSISTYMHVEILLVLVICQNIPQQLLCFEFLGRHEAI